MTTEDIDKAIETTQEAFADDPVARYNSQTPVSEAVMEIIISRLISFPSRMLDRRQSMATRRP